MAVDGKVVYEVDYDTKKAKTGLSKLGTSLDNIEKKAGQVGSFMTKNVTAPMVALGGAADRIGSRSALIICFTLISVALFWLLVSRELWMLYLFAVIFGLGYGGLAPLASLVVAEQFGLSAHGTILGSTDFVFTIGSATGPALAGRIFDTTGSYQLAFSMCAALSVIAIILALLLRPIADLRNCLAGRRAARNLC